MRSRQHKAETSEPPCLIFLHVPKTGGRTLRATLRFKYPSETLIFYAMDKPLEDFERIPVEERRRARVVTGHFPYGIHRHIPQRCEYVTMLREPISRMVSRWHATEKRIGRPGHWSFDERGRSTMGFDEWLEAAGATVANVQTRMIAGRPRGHVVDRDDLEQAKDNLDRFLVVGLTERYDESFILMRRGLGWKLPLYATRNVRKAAPASGAELPADAIERMRTVNALDLELYAHAQDLLRERLGREGASLKRELAAFRALNRVPELLAPRVPETVRRRLASALPR